MRNTGGIGKKLRDFRLSKGLSLREAARQLHVAHVTLRAWESEERTPGNLFRAAIQTWTGGKIRSVDWPAGMTERAARAAVALVRRVRTGTDG